ncbi:hypothetical protein NPIL_229941 [Nephila pilipes]|uniref:Uncharacterized protein n=1 Tax=Nephila pilipes TaxID=299642 RepID=A0A8X6IZJ6_NEPPI|nr:hypothetical protein NPIL_229941 [Nephila pilipes]
MVTYKYEYLELLFDSQEKEENIEKEIDLSESYIDKWRVLENKLHELINEKKEHSPASTVSGVMTLDGETLKAREWFRTAHRRVKEETSEESTSCSKKSFSTTLAVLVEGENGKRKERSIIDSMRSYILKTTAEELKFNSNRREYLQHSLFGGPIHQPASMMF